MSQFPAWLNSDYFQDILRRHYKNSSIKVRSVKIEPCGSANDGFLSEMLRVHVAYFANSNDEIESFVAKLDTNHELVIEKVGSAGYDVQKKEMLFYEVIAPQMQKIFNKTELSEKILPKVVAIDPEHDVILFEDLKSLDFIMADRMAGMDEIHVKLGLEKLARFHAASLIIRQKHPKSFESFDVGMFSRKVKAFNFAFLSIYEHAVEEIKTWSGYENYATKMDRMRSSFIENATRCFDYQPGDFCVLNHGDVWTNNFMFKYGSNGDPEEAVLIDFQFCHWGSPALDLYHFLYTSLSNYLYTQETIDGFVQDYYYELKRILINLDYDLDKFPKLHAFQMEMIDKMFYGLVYTLTVFPVMTSDDVDNDFIAHHSSDDRAVNFKKRILKSPRYQEVVKRMLPVFDRKGLLDDFA